MALDRDRAYREMASRGKYRRLYQHLRGLDTDEWQTTFGEVESIAGFPLPRSARFYRPWWANQSSGSAHSQSLAWSAAGWETAKVNMDAETLLFRRKPTGVARKLTLDEIWPVHPTATWPQALSLSREDIYEERI